MAKVIIVGAGGVGQVVTHKCAQVPEVFSEIVLASRNEAKCRHIASQIARPIATAQVDANNVAEMAALRKVIHHAMMMQAAAYNREPAIEVLARARAEARAGSPQRQAMSALPRAGSWACSAADSIRA